MMGFLKITAAKGSIFAFIKKVVLEYGHRRNMKELGQHLRIFEASVKDGASKALSKECRKDHLVVTFATRSLLGSLCGG
jgi:hypothetical protein